nr:unnamed protein product [Callosobruchus analis]
MHPTRDGGTSESHVNQKDLVESTEILAHQQKGAVCCFGNASITSNQVKETVSDDTIGQQNCSFIHSKSRGNKVPTIARPHTSYIKSCEPNGNDCSDTIHSKRVQQHSRQAFTPETTTRLALIKESRTHDFQEAGKAHDRLVCNTPIPDCSKLCLKRRQGSFGDFHQCFQQTMELPSGMGFPTTMSHPSTIETSQSCFRNLHCHSPRLVHKPTAPPKPLIKVGSLEDTGWSKAINHWKNEDAQLLISSWRQSTLKTYSAPWKEWLLWASKKNITPQNPTSDQLAQYLGFLHRVKKLAPATIKLHKSVVANFANPMESENLSNSPVVKHMLKAIDLSRPPVGKKQTWNINKLLSWLDNDSVDNTSIFQVSRHLAVILLLASGRRIHDLTLLKIDANYMEMTEDTVVFWPEFGSKTDKKLMDKAFPTVYYPLIGTQKESHG